MDILNRKTVNFDRQDSQLVAPFLDASTSEHATLEALVGQPLSSDSAELRALVLLGVRHVQEALLEDAYNEAVDAGDFDDTRDWVRQTRARRNRSRFEWVHVVRITSRPKRPLPTVVELGDADVPVHGRAMVDEVEMVHKDDLEDRRGSLSPATMRAIDDALRRVFSLN